MQLSDKNVFSNHECKDSSGLSIDSVLSLQDIQAETVCSHLRSFLISKETHQKKLLPFVSQHFN